MPDFSRLEPLFSDYCEATGLTAGLILAPENPQVLNTGACRLRRQFHDEVPGIPEKRNARVLKAVTAAVETGEPEIWTCPAGLTDAVAPVVVDGRAVAWVVAGGVFPGRPDLRKSRGYAKRRGFNIDDYLAAVKSTPVIPEDAFRAHLRFLASLVANEIRSREKDTGQPGSTDFTTVFDEVYDALLLMQDNRFIQANEGAARIFGTSVTELIGATPIEYSPEIQPSGLPSDEAAIQHIAKVYTEGPQRFEWRHLKADGTEFDADVTLAKIDFEGQTRTLALVRDISDMKRLLSEVERNRDMYRDLYSSAFVGLFRTRIGDGQFLRLNKVTADYFGFESPQAALAAGVKSEDFYAEEDRAYILSELESKGEVADHIIRFNYPGGLTRDIALTLKSYPELGYIEGSAVDVTARLHYEAELRKSRDLYRDMYSTAVVGLFRSRISDDRIIKINKIAAAILKFDSPEDVIEADVRPSDYYPEETRLELMEKLRQDGRADEFNLRFTFPDGSTKDLALSMIAYPDRDYLEGVVVDITERKKVEDELHRYREHLEELVEKRTSEVRQFQRFIESSNQGMGWSTLEGTIVYLNTKFLELLGIAPGVEVAGRNMSEFFDEDTEQLMKETVVPELLKHGECRIEHDTRRRDGKVTPTESNLYLLKDGEGKPQYVASVVTDLTERKTAEQQVLELNTKLSYANESLSAMNEELTAINEEMQATNEELRVTNDELGYAQRKIEQFMRFVENSNQGMGWIDNQGIIRFVNQGMCKILRYDSPKELIGRDVSVMHDVETQKTLIQPVIEEVLSTGSAEVQIPMLRKDGTIVQVYHSFNLLKDENGEPLLIANVSTDLTDRIKAEQAVYDLNARLSEANESLSAMNEELQAANEEMQATNEELQATNEDLDSTQRELQQLNEQLEHRVEERTAALRRSEELFRLTTTAADVGLWDYNAQTGQIHNVNDIWFTMLGYLPDEYPPTMEFWDSLIHPDDKEMVQQRLRDYIETYEGRKSGDDFYSTAFRMQAKNGSYRWILSRGEAVSCGPDGRPNRMAGIHTDITELKKVEHQLEQSQELFRVATTAATIGLWDFNPQTGKIYRFNDIWFTMLGYDPDEFPHTLETWQQLLHPDDIESTLIELKKYLEGDLTVYSPIFRMKANDGMYRWMLARGEIVERDSDGHATRMTGTHTDITALKQIERELAQSQEWFRLALASANVGFWDINTDTYEVIHFSDQFFQMLGFSPDEFPHTIETFHYLVHVDDFDAGREYWLRYREGDMGEYSHVFRMRHKDGGYRWILARGSTIERNRDGKPMRIAGIHTDITDLKAVEEELNRTQLDLKNSYLEMVQIFDTASSGMRVVDLDGMVKYANRRFADICGRSILDMTGASHDLVDTGCMALLAKEPDPLASALTADIKRINITRPDGETRVCEVRSVPYLDYNGEMVGILEDFQDVTEAMQAEHERHEFVNKLIKANEALECSQRELKDSQNQLLQSEKLAAIGELASGVAHELNQPLNHISITAQLLERILKKEKLSPEEITSELQVIRIAVERAVAIIRNMRDFSRKDEEEHSPVDVRLAVSNALSMFGAQLRTHNIELHVEQPVEPVLVLGTENSLVQVMVNLISNARDALDSCDDDRGKAIRINIEEDEGHVLLVVEDNGMGIPEHLLGTIFNPFYTSKEPGEGTGLGLSITYRIISGMQGSITADSIKNEWTKLIIRLPSLSTSGVGDETQGGTNG